MPNQLHPTMKTKTRIHSLLAVPVLLLASMPAAHADPAAAEDDCYSMAVFYTQRGYAMSPTNYTGLGGSGYTVRFLVPVSKGLDYVFLVGIDNAVRDADVYVYDEVGGLILDDRRSTARAGVKFRSSYNGTAQVYVHLARADGLGAFSVLVGRRGVDKSAGGPVDGASENPGDFAPAPKANE
jgi:hypothetical protein